MFVGQTKKKVDIKNIRPHTLREEEVFGKKTSKKIGAASRPLPCRRCPPGDTYGFGKKEAVSLTFLLFAISLSLSPEHVVYYLPPPPPSPPLFLPGKRSGATFTQFPRTKKSSYTGLGVALFSSGTSQRHTFVLRPPMKRVGEKREPRYDIKSRHRRSICKGFPLDPPRPFTCGKTR